MKSIGENVNDTLWMLKWLFIDTDVEAKYLFLFRILCIDLQYPNVKSTTSKIIEIACKTTINSENNLYVNCSVVMCF